jgi:hypothetical protein
MQVAIRCCYEDYMTVDVKLLWWICSTIREADILSELTDVSERLAQMIVMETACLQTVEIYYCGGFVPLFVTMCHSLSSCVLP